MKKIGKIEKSETMKKILIFILLFIHIGLMGQDMNIKVELSTDSILIGSLMEIRFTIENAEGDFEAPGFEGFEIVSGPNTTSTYTVNNGNATQKTSYSYVIRPNMEGLIYVDPANFKIDEKILETEPVSVMVYPNPLGIQENKTFLNYNDSFYDSFFFPRERKVESKKKKHKFEHMKRKI